ncbi:Pectinacetylesterase family protein isoform 1 [Hibiscus syriacus]|uniref:Pectinacetylesterase family protein isoform 1 n=1 Tax=Hibiscus syriacus TaxID=106335 RepID=A0A6A3APA9_HIBSY|nr:probable protein phosphatase 2C 4 [Hibiscus syriacus]KAE8706026.1 Pectinacetylesterase family protein isoform 1 [Hibiscus syriacus]
MGNSFRKLSQCCSFNGAGSHEMMMASHVMPHPSDEFIGHSFCYVRPDPILLSSAENHSSINSSSSSSSSTNTTTTFSSISGASVGANLTTVPFAAAVPSPLPDRSSTFKSSELVASLTLQPVPRGNSHCWSAPMDRGFLSSPIIEFNKRLSDGSFSKSKKKGSFSIKSFKRALFFVSEKEISSAIETETNNPSSGKSLNVNDHGDQTDEDDDDDGDGYRLSMKSQNLQWAQGKAGEDRTHLVVSEEEGWIFVGIYDGFSGPDAPDHLLNNLFHAVFEVLKGISWNNGKAESDEAMGFDSKKWKCDCDRQRFELSMNSTASRFKHSDFLKALSEALTKTEETYLKMADLKPELHAMGSCVLVMLMNGEDIYVMNLGDSRAIIAQKTQSSNLIPHQLTMDHNSDVKEEVERIRKEHPDDDEAVVNERVKGYLKVTRAFGAGFLKQPKWNDALCEIFRINYVGTSPYITSSPSLYHYKLSPDDRFLILSSDGLYQYLTNQQVVSQIEWFTASFPDGDPAQHLIEEVLIRAAEKAGLDFHELIEIPSGERRIYHDDVSVIIISLEGRIWRSSVNSL